MPSRKRVFNYWQMKNHCLTTKFIDQDENTCFACGRTSGIERAHLVAKVNKGSDTVDNLHLLCKSCHFKLEGIYETMGESFYYRMVSLIPYWLTEFEYLISKMHNYGKTKEKTARQLHANRGGAHGNGMVHQQL